MKTAIKFVAILMILGLALIAMPAGKVNAATICVNTDGSGGCLTDIQAAITAATPSDTITVAAGTYTVSNTIVVDKAVTISGDAGAIVLGTGTTATTLSIFKITASDVTIQGLEIVHNSLPAFGSFTWDELNWALVQVPGYLSLTNISILGNTIRVPEQTPGSMGTWGGVALGIGRTNSSTIIGNTIYNTRNGIVIQYNNSATITGNTIYNTKGGIMNYTGSQADADARVMTNNTWGTIHNEWDMVWNSGGGPYEMDMQKSVLQVSQANNDAYVCSLMNSPSDTYNIKSNRSHVFVNVGTGTETIKGANGNINLPYKTVALGIDAVVPGGKVLVAAGTYTGQVNITKRLSLIGAGMDGSAPTIISANTVGTVLLSATGTETSPILLKDIQITGPYGIRTNTTPIDYVTWDHVWLNANPVKAGEGFRINYNHQVTHLTIKDSIIEGYIDGVIIEKYFAAPCNPDLGTKLQYVTVTDTIFRNNYRKGMYTETLSDATFTNVQLIDNGYVNPGTNLAEYNSAGFDLNLKNGTYVNLNFINMTATGNGLKAKDGAALMIKARDDGASYSVCPATLDNVLISGGSFTGNERGIRFGEPGKTNAGPTNVSLDKVKVYGNVQTYTGTDGSAYGDVVNYTAAGLDASPEWWGQATGPTASQMYGSMTYIPWCSVEDCSQTAGPVTNITQHKGYATIQAAINEATSGDVLSVAAGTFVENVVVDVPVEIYGAGQGNTIVMPAVSAANPCTGSSLCGGTASNVFLVQASNVKIHDLTIDGDNPALTSGIVRGTPDADLDARNGIIKNTDVDYNNLEVYNTTVQNIYLRGIYSTGGSFNFHHNTVTNVQGDGYSIGMFAWGGPGTFANNTVSYANDGISANHSKGIQFLNNTVTHSGSGIHTDNSNDAGGVADLIQGNSVNCYSLPNAYGIWTFVPYVAPTINNNTITNCSVGLSAWGQGAVVIPQFTNNSVTGDSTTGSVGAYITTDLIGYGYTDVSVYFEGNTISGFEYGVQLAGNQQIWNSYPFVASTINATFYKNKILNYTYSVSKDTGGLAYNANLANNYWGSACGPSNISSGITYSPWYADEAMLNPVSGAVGSYNFAPGTSTAAMNATIACAAPGSTFTFLSGNHNGDIVIPAGQEHLTFTLKNGAIINANSPCFTVNASYTTITTESIGGAKCIPTGGSNGIDVASGLVNIILKGMEIDGTSKETGAGISFAGAIEDVQVVDNYIHDLDGDGLLFNAQPAGVIDIQGNMFKGNTGLGVNNLNGTAPINATYNSWGSQGGPEGAGGDGVSDNVTFSPWTNVDLYLNSADSPWEFQVVKGSNITITVKGDLSNVTGASFKLEYDTSLLDLVSATPTSLFLGVPPIGTLLDTATDGVVKYDGYNATAVSGTGQLFYTLVFTGTASGTAYVRFDETTDVFGMSPTAGPSNNIYANTLADGSVKVIDLPTLNIVPLETCYAGLPCQFQLHITNPANGENPTEPWYLNFSAPTGTILEFNNGSTWDVITSGWVLGGVTPGVTITPTFRATFYTPGSNPMSVFLMDPAPAPDFQLATDDETFAVAGNFSLLGTFSMQGRVFRGGIPVTLTWAGTPAYAPLGTTVDIISKNLSMSLTYGGVYTITTNQPRYLNVTADLLKTVTLSAARTMNALELKGGNAQWLDNEISVLDAGIIGGQWGSLTPGDGDVNFDGKVNIQDLALVGGNWGSTSAGVYGTWVP